MELCELHVAEIEKMEKRRGGEGFVSDRDILLAGGGQGDFKELFVDNVL
jgi:hypothetical protein